MKGIRWLALMGGGFLLAGTGSIARNLSTPWRLVSGEVLRAELVYSKDGSDPDDVASQVQVEYRYRCEGRGYTGFYRSVLSSGEFFKRRFVERHRSGDPVSIRVDPSDPARSRLKIGFFRENELGLGLSIIGVFFLLLFARL
mgnify:FL=1